MSRLLLIIAIVAMVYLLIRSYRRKTLRQETTTTEDMVRCSHCGMHLPRGESIAASGKYFCGSEHRDAYFK
jgi:uncharacterized protein